MKNILVTGVSSGLGRHASEYFLSKGWRVFGSVRNPADARPLLENPAGNFVPLIFDVRSQKDVDNARQQVAGHLHNGQLDVLVNNAGIAVYGPLLHVPVQRFEEQLAVNVTGLLRVTQAFLPMLGARRDFSGTPGTIINISSVSGLFAYPFVGPYAASKHAVEALSDCLRRELSIYDIKVVVIEPASIRSQIWQKAREAPTYAEGTDYAGMGKAKDRIVEKIIDRAHDPMRVTRLIWRIAQGRARRTRYLLSHNNFLFRLMAAAPDKWVDHLFRRRFRRSQWKR